MVRRRMPAVVGALTAALVAIPVVVVAAGGAAAAQPTDVFFSEYVEGTSNNKALEIYNGTGAPVDLAAGSYNVQMFFNGSVTSGLTINLTGTVAGGDVYVLAQASASPSILAVADQTNGAGWFNGDDAVVLRRGTTVVDSIGQVGFDPGSEWGAGLTSTADNTLRRKAAVVAGDPAPSDPFDPAVEWDGFPTDAFGGLGGHLQPALECPPVTGPAGTTVSAAVSASDPDGTVVDISLASVSPDPGTFSRVALSPAPAVGGTATATFAASPATPAGTYTLTITATNDDPIPQTGTCALTVTVAAVRHIGEIQGEVLDGQDGSTHHSPFNGQIVLVRGVVAERTLGRSARGVLQRGFFLQEVASATDGDPLTSDGIFVFTSSFETLIGGYLPVVGDEIIVSARISEFFDLTELTSASLVALVRSGVDLDAELPAFEANPPDSLADAERYWERHEGMRARIPAGSLVVDGRNVFPSTADSELWAIHPDHAVAQRADPFARRVFRDPHPLDNVASQLFDDGNGYRIVIGPLGVKQAAGDSTELLTPATTFDTITNDLVGGVYFSFDKYQIEVGTQPQLSAGVQPDQNAPPAPPDRAREATIATFNVENLYDFRNDPFDGCDFAGDPGCPGVSPPFDYVPASQAAYDDHLRGLAAQIAGPLHAPDLMLVQEAEDQDICSVAGGALSCGAVDDADGRPDTLQELALAIADAGGPAYDAAYDRDGADDRGIVSAFLYRIDRVDLLPAAPSDPVLGSSPTVSYRGDPLAYNTDVQNPKVLNAELPGDVDTSTGVDGSNVFTRPPQVGHFRLWRDGVGGSLSVDLWALSNHFSSTPQARVGQRTEQAAYAAAIATAIEAADGDAPVVVGGDLNVFPRPDDPFSPGDPLFPSDQLAGLYDAGLHDLWDVLVAEAPASAYSYVFDGQAQTLDHLIVNDALFDDLITMRAAHVNADHPAGVAASDRGVSDHDPQVARFAPWSSLDRLVALLDAYVQDGSVSAEAAPRLAKRLSKAQQFLDAGDLDAYRDQLEAFISQVEDRSPSQVTPAAAEVLIAEAEFLLAES